MKEFQITRYIQKWLLPILLFFVLMTGFFYRMFLSMQTYTASAVIRYSNAEAVDGLTPSNEPIDVTEIYSSSVITRVVQNLKLDQDKYSIDKLASGVTVTPIEKTETETIKEALNEQGEKYEEKPTDYIVSFTADSKGSNEFARSVLNEILDVYFSDYSERYVNVATINNRTDEALQSGYDYIEIMENLQGSIQETLDALNERNENAPYFRSVSTGYTFSDLINEFSFLKNVEISKAFSDILKNQLSKNKEVLITKYQNRISNYNLNQESEEKSVKSVLNIINAYVRKMRASGNTNITNDYILPDVYDKNQTDDSGEKIESDKTVEYDKLLKSWIEHKEKAAYAAIDITYCNYMIGEFTKKNEIPPEEYEQFKGQMEGTIQSISTKMNGLYDKIEQANGEYNAYIGALNITVLSSAAAAEKINIKLYTALIGLFFLVIGCCGAIVLGRIGDIVEYMFYMDRNIGCSNRVACDRYIDSMSAAILNDHFGCVSLRITNQKELNQKYGRERCDEAMREIKNVLERLFGRAGTFIGYNGGGQFLLFSESVPAGKMEEALKKLKFLLKEDTACKELDIQYLIGGSVSGELGIFQIRSLITKAIENSTSQDKEGNS